MSNNSNGFLENNETNTYFFKKREKQIRRRILAIICLIIAAIAAVIVIFIYWRDTVWGMITDISLIIGIIAGIITIHDKLFSNNEKGD